MGVNRVSTFICEKCGRVDNSACSNNYWHARGVKYSKSKGEGFEPYFKPEYSYFEDHTCCSICCDGIEYEDGSGVIKRGKFDFDEDEMKHWSHFGKEKLLEWEALNRGDMVNATEYLKSIGEL